MKWTAFARLGFLLISFIGYAYIGHVHQRSAFLPYFFICLSLFAAYFALLYSSSKIELVENTKFYTWFFFALVLRGSFIGSYPTLSDDFWRYIWDARLLLQGTSPYAYLPEAIVGTDIEKQANLSELYRHLNSPKYYSVYPPVSQLYFFPGAYLFPNSILKHLVVLQLTQIGTSACILTLLRSVLQHFKKADFWWFVYAFNPLIILEYSGNLHTEQFMLAGLLLLIWGLQKNTLLLSGLGYIIAIMAKLHPLLLFPGIIVYLRSKAKAILWSTLVSSGLLILFYSFMGIQSWFNISQSIQLYFETFEFNGSIYNVFRKIIFLNDWDNIHRVKVWLPRVSILIILYLAWLNLKAKTNLLYWINTVLFSYFSYLLFATTIHPWYIGILLLFGVISGWWFPIIWTCMIQLTYSIYDEKCYEEHNLYILIQYIVVVVALIYEIYKKKK